MNIFDPVIKDTDDENFLIFLAITIEDELYSSVDWCNFVFIWLKSINIERFNKTWKEYIDTLS